MISTTHDSPLGPLTLVSNGTALTALAFENHKHPVACPPSGEDNVLDLARRELDAYFSGKLRRFSVPARGKGTPFQERAWKALLAIPYGATRTT